MKLGVLVLATALLAACQSARRPDAPSTPGVATADAALAGTFDNHEQVLLARSEAAAAMPGHATIVIEPTASKAWTLWRIHLDATPALDALWAMRLEVGAGGAAVLTPARALVSAPATGSAFDPAQWATLDACAAKGTSTPAALVVSADAAACAALAPGVGAAAALIPIVVDREGEWLHVRLYADQARGADARTDARLVHWFAGWTAINGAGPKAAADSSDWHMDRDVRLGSEGGRYELHWRDGAPAGYALGLERMTYRDGNVPVLKLSIIDDANGATLAYAWADPEATRIGINLGWVQVGLESTTTSTSRPRH